MPPAVPSMCKDQNALESRSIHIFCTESVQDSVDISCIDDPEIRKLLTIIFSNPPTKKTDQSRKTMLANDWTLEATKIGSNIAMPPPIRYLRTNRK
jgi:hypothetical protein